MVRKVRISSVLLLLTLLLLWAVPARAVTVSDIGTQLICQCGCTMVLNNCTHAECHSREEMLNTISLSLEQGKSEEQIIASFVAQYGEQVLASPPKRGFNLVAWILPFVAILLGAGVIYLALRVWVGRGRIQPLGTVSKAEEMDEQYLGRLEKELKEFRERGFR